MTKVMASMACGVAACLVAAALLLPVDPAAANPLPPWDHYKTYLVGEPPIYHFEVELEDQFGAQIYVTELLEQLGVPVVKNNEPINDPGLHYTWWVIHGREPGRRVVVDNQFGEQGLDVGDARYLWNPALKNPEPGQGPPLANHYKCYQAWGHPLQREVTLVTQFGNEVAVVMEPEIFCNPTAKLDLVNGMQYPVVDPHQHYVCYRLEPVHPMQESVGVLDQFLLESLFLVESRYLCVPSLKTGVTPALPSTWGRVKGLYR